MTSGSLPVAGLPRFLGISFIDLAINRSYLKSEPNGSAHFRPALTAARNNR